MVTPNNEENKLFSDAERLEQEARSLYKAGDLEASLEILQRAYQLSPSDRLKRRIDRLLNLLKPKEYSEIDRLIEKTADLSIHIEAQEPRDKQTAETLLSEARILFEAGDTLESLAKIKEAYTIHPNPKTFRKIERLEAAKDRDPSDSTSPTAITTKSFEDRRSASLNPESSKNSTVDSEKSYKKSDITSVAKFEATVDEAEKEANEHIKLARSLMKEGRLEDALGALVFAYSLNPNPKISQRINQLQTMLASSSSQKETRESSTSFPSAELASERSSELEKRARALFKNKDYRGTLDLLLQADKLCPSDKLKRRIERLRNLMAEEEKEEEEKEEENDEDIEKDEIDALTRDTSSLSIGTSVPRRYPVGGTEMAEVTKGFYLPHRLYEKLYPYQKEGVAWLWKLHNTSPGGILADDMGLGKTLQAIAFLTGFFLCEEEEVNKRKPRTALILAPVSVLQTWQSEFAKFSPSLRLYTYYELTKNARHQVLLSLQSRGGILLTSYNTLMNGIDEIATHHQFGSSGWLSSNREQYYTTKTFSYDYLILDEAHRIKNRSTKISQAVRALDCKHRLLLTGTAVQNNLRELWSLLDFTHSGHLLGSQKTFLMQYEKPIIRSRERDASNAERLHGTLMANSLTKIIEPFVLRRTKQDTLSAFSKQKIPQKNEIVVWLYLSSLQEAIYRNFLNLDHVKELLFCGSTKRSPLVELTILKKLCDHPRLLSTEQCVNLGLDVSQSLPGSDIRAPSYRVLLEESGKIDFVVRLLEHFQREALQSGESPHRTLIFSQSLRLLNMTEAAILGMNKEPNRPPELPKHRILRLDGRLKKLEERNAVLEKFKEDLRYTVMLLTTQVGGVGLTITSADRVIILDPSWNPSIDAQAVDRVYRIGQRSNVVVYRLITCATVEEKIYRRQVFKNSVIRQTIDRTAVDRKSDTNLSDPYRYFTRQELFELFTLDANPRYSATQRQLAEIHGSIQRRTYPELESHLDFVKSMTDLVFDISDHDLLFSRIENHDDGNDTHQTDADVYFAESRMRLGEAALALEAAKDFAASKKLQEQAYTLKKPVYNNPAGEIFIPSKADSHRAMFNAPGLGISKNPVAGNFVKASALLPSKSNSSLFGETDNRIISSLLSDTHSRRDDLVQPSRLGLPVTGEIFIPSKKDSPRSTFNAAGNPASSEFGESGTFLVPEESKGASRFSGEAANSTNSTLIIEPHTSGRESTIEKADFVRPSGVFLQPPSDEDIPLDVSPPLDMSDVIDVDLTQNIDESELDKSMPLTSLRKSLAASGILLGVEEMGEEDPMVIGDSCDGESNLENEGSKEQIVEGKLSDSVEIVEDSFVSDQ
ncbi:hypothetical protein Aperf_G00000006586 [Anoplocephala perfoliata]